MNRVLLVVAFIMIVLYVGKSRKCVRLETQVKETKQICDSLQSELFTSDVQLNRYQLTLEILSEQNPEVADIFEETMSQETE